MSGYFSNKKGFSLLEVLVSILIVGVVAGTAWIAISAFSKSNEETHNRVRAVNLLQLSQEEVRRYVQNNGFDFVDNCSFANPGTCSFTSLANLAVNFPGFTRTLAVLPDLTTTELKTVQVTVQWNELGTLQTLTSSVVLTRPANQQPGNIRGQVRDADTGNLIGNILVTVTNIGTVQTFPALTGAGADANGNNFDFIGAGGGMVLPTGNWNLTAVDNDPTPRYLPYDYATERGGSITVNENATTDLIAATNTDILMTPVATEARIKVRLVEAGGGTLPFSFLNLPDIRFPLSRSSIVLYQNGQEVQRTTEDLPTFEHTFDIPFAPDEQGVEKCFTVATLGAYYSGLVGVRPPACQTGTLTHFSDGWSSAVSQGAGCNPISWRGNSATDRATICVRAGDEPAPIDIPLVITPTQTITGQAFYAGTTNPVDRARIYVTWHDSGDWRWTGQGVPQFTAPEFTTGADGRFSFLVPAEQNIFVNASNRFLNIWAQKEMEATACCGIEIQKQGQAPTLKYGPVTTSSTPGPITFEIEDVQDSECGDVEGTVYNDKTGLVVPAARVIIGIENAVSNGSGYYLFACQASDPDPSIRKVEQGHHVVSTTGSANTYYRFHSLGNNWYESRGAIDVKKNIVNNVASSWNLSQGAKDPNIRIWPAESHTFVVEVQHAADPDQLLNDVTVTLRAKKLSITGLDYEDVVLTGVSGRAGNPPGRVIFTNVLGTWPPQEVLTHPNKANYNLTPVTYTIEAEHGSYETEIRSGIIVPTLDGLPYVISLEENSQS